MAHTSAVSFTGYGVVYKHTSPHLREETVPELTFYTTGSYPSVEPG